MARKSNLNTSLSDVKIHSISIIPKDGKPISIESLWNVINLHESIFRPVITGNIQINDTINLRASFQFKGEEKIYIYFSKPSIAATGQARYAREFIIDGMTDLKQNEGGGASYTLRFYSKELYVSRIRNISRAFNGGTYTDYVKAICKTDLEIQENQLGAIEDSFGVADSYNIKDKKPFDVIELFERKAINEAKSPFLFYENLYGFNFVSLSRMFDGTSIIPGGLIVSTARNSEDAANYVPVKFNEILNFKYEKIGKLSDQTNLQGRLEQIDILRGDFSAANFKLSDMDSGNLANKDSTFPISAATKPEDGARMLWLTSKDRSNMPYRLTSFANSRISSLNNISAYPMETNVRENNTNEENYLLQRQAMINLLEYSVISSCEVAGNPAFTVGVPVDITVPAFSKNDELKRNVDPYLSGRYVIAKVRHNLTKSTGLRTFVSLATNSPLNPLI